MAMLWTDAVVEYVTRYDPKFGDRIRGATPESIENLERMVGRPLPEVYRQYLERFGRDDGGLFHDQRADARVQSMLQYYRDTHAENPDANFSRIIPFAAGDVFDAYALEIRSSGEPRVILAEEDQPVPDGLLADSLPALVFNSAFVGWSQTIGPRANYRFPDDKATNAALRAHAQSLGFRIEWFSDSGHVCAVNDKAVALLYVNQRLPLRPHVSLVAPSEDRARELGDAFAAPFGGAFTKFT